MGSAQHPLGNHHPPRPHNFILINKLLLALGVVEVQGGVVGWSGVRYSKILDVDLDVGVAEWLSPGVWLRVPPLVPTTLFKTRGAVSGVGMVARRGKKRGLAAKLLSVVWLVIH